MRQEFPGTYTNVENRKSCPIQGVKQTPPRLLVLSTHERFTRAFVDTLYRFFFRVKMVRESTVSLPDRVSKTLIIFRFSCLCVAVTMNLHNMPRARSCTTFYRLFLAFSNLGFYIENEGSQVYQFSRFFFSQNCGIVDTRSCKDTDMQGSRFPVF